MSLHHPPRRAAVTIFTSLPKRLGKRTRATVEAAVAAHLDAVEALTAFLDRVDGDSDLEPSIYPANGNTTLAALDTEGGDVQDEPHDDADEGNAEPSLAHTNALDQASVLKLHSSFGVVAGAGDRDWFRLDADLEAEHDGREDDGDSEPSLGSTGDHVQTGWAAGSRDDLELAPGDEEPGDEATF